MAVRQPGDPGITSLQNESIKAIRDNIKAVTGNTASHNALKNATLSNLDFTGRLTTVIQRQEQLQLQSLAAGTTALKFGQQNVQALKDNISTNQEMTGFLIGGFQRGLRDLSRSTVDLADDMMLTGQNTQALIGSMGNLTLLTDDSNKSQGKLSKAITKNTSEYGITATSMIQALNAVRSSLEEAAVYGDDAVNAYADSAASLKAAMGGAEGADKSISILLNMANSLNVGQQQQLGLTEIMQDLRDGNSINHDELIQAGQRLRAQFSSNQQVADSLTNAYGRAQVQALLQVTKGLMKGNKLSAEMKAQEQDKINTITAQKKNVDKFYETYAPGMYEYITKYLPLMLAAATVGPGAVKMTGNLIANAAAGTLGAGAASTGFKVVAKRIIGSLGFIGAAAAGIWAVSELVSSDTKSTAKNTKAAKEQLKKDAKERARKNQEPLLKPGTLARAASLASGMLRKGSGPSETKQLISVIKALVDQQNKNAAATSNLADVIESKAGI